MAKCDEGYICQVCGTDVGSITDSDLYLRFVMGIVDPETLHTTPERHIRCNPALAQFIDDPRFEPVRMDGDMARDRLDPAYAEQRRQRVTRAYARLWDLKTGGERSLIDYPLPE